MEEKSMKKKIGDFVSSYMIEGIIIVACISYLVLGVAEIIPSDKSIAQIIADGTLAFIFGSIISHLLRKKGMLKGECCERFLSTLEEFAVVVQAAKPDIDKIDGYIDRLNGRVERKAKENLLLGVGLNYDKYLKGEYAEADLCTQQKTAINKMLKMRVKKLNKFDLLSEQGKREQKLETELGDTKSAFERKKSVSSNLSKLMMVVVFSYFGLGFIAGVSVANVIWSLVQVVVFLLTGVVQYVLAYEFISDEYRERIVRKRLLLEEFIKENKKQEKQEKQEIKENKENE